MPKTKNIRGQVIRIVDTRTVIIDLGRKDGITDDSIFYILAEPEEIVHPFRGEKLGKVTVVKSKLKSAQVYESFTIATTRWIINVRLPNDLISAVASQYDKELIDLGELFVNPKEIQPWQAISETPVRVGDIVEVKVEALEPEVEEEREFQSVKTLGVLK